MLECVWSYLICWHDQTTARHSQDASETQPQTMALKFETLAKSIWQLFHFSQKATEVHMHRQNSGVTNINVILKYLSSENLTFKVIFLLTHTQIMLLTHHILVFVAKAYIGGKKTHQKSHLKLVSQTDCCKNACYFLNRTWCHVGLWAELANQLAWIFLMTGIRPYHSVVGVHLHYCNAENLCFNIVN